jgi:hypothetical protein
LFPLLADLEFEHAKARSSWARGVVRISGVLAFWRAFGVTAASDSAHHLWTNAWGATQDETRTTRALVARVGATSSIFTLVLILNQWSFLGRFSASLWPPLVASLIPCIAMVAIPIGVLFGFALGGERGWKSHARGPASIAVLATLVTFSVGAWLTPEVNQRHRELVWRILVGPLTTPLSKGDREMSLDELALRAAELRSSGQGKEAGRFELEWHKKFALGASCLTLALAGAAITLILRERFWRFLAAVAVLNACYLLLRIGEQASDLGRLAPALAMWGPFLLIAAVSLAVLATSRRSIVVAASNR